MQFRGYGQQGAGERRRGGGRGRGRGRKDQRGAARADAYSTAHLVDYKGRRSVLEQSCELHSRLMTLALALHYAAL